MVARDVSQFVEANVRLQGRKRRRVWLERVYVPAAANEIREENRILPNVRSDVAGNHARPDQSLQKTYGFRFEAPVPGDPFADEIERIDIQLVAELGTHTAGDAHVEPPFQRRQQPVGFLVLRRPLQP